MNIGSGQLYKDASGNVGIGTTPSAWHTANNVKALQVSTFGAAWQQSSGAFNIGANAYENAANAFKYITSNPAILYSQDTGSGQHRWYTAPSGTAGNAITFTQAMTLDNSGVFSFNSGYGSAAIAYGCRAWVNFNASGTVAGSGSVTSVTVNSTANYTVNFSITLPDANYAFNLSAQRPAGNTGMMIFQTDGTNPTTTSLRFATTNQSAQVASSAFNCVSIFR